MINEKIKLLEEYVLRGEQCVTGNQMESAADWFLAAEKHLPAGSRLTEFMSWEQQIALRLIGDYYFQKSIDEDASTDSAVLSREWYLKTYDDRFNPSMEFVYMGWVWLTRGNAQEAFQCFSNALRDGNSIALCEMARLYTDGQGIEKDLHKAEGLLVRAYYEGVERAAEDLREFCLKGYGSRFVRTLVIDHYTEKSKEDSNVALELSEWYEKGILVPQDYEKALTSYLSIPEFESRDDVLYKIGYFYQHGLGVEQDYEKAVYYYKIGVNNDTWAYSKCDNALGECYFYGHGVPQNYSTALDHCRRAAYNGNVEAAFNVGFLYENGYGIEKDLLKAEEWYKKAADEGYVLAQEALSALQNQLAHEAAIVKKYMSLFHSTEPREYQMGKRTFIDNEPVYLAISKDFAERNLSASALKYADQTETHYQYMWDRTSYIVAFELPLLYKIHPLEITRFLVNYCMPYMIENNITDDVLHHKYMENYKRLIVE